MRFQLKSLRKKLKPRSKSLRKLSRHLFVMFIILLVFTSVVLFTAQIKLNDYLNAAINERGYYPALDERLHYSNNLIQTVIDAQTGRYSFDNLVLDVSEKTPAQIKLNSININKATKTLTLSGVALTREDLLGYEKSLSRSLYLRDARLPHEATIKAADISFTITADLRLENLK